MGNALISISRRRQPRRDRVAAAVEMFRRFISRTVAAQFVSPRDRRPLWSGRVCERRVKTSSIVKYDSPTDGFCGQRAMRAAPASTLPTSLTQRRGVESLRYTEDITRRRRRTGGRASRHRSNVRKKQRSPVKVPSTTSRPNAIRELYGGGPPAQRTDRPTD